MWPAKNGDTMMRCLVVAETLREDEQIVKAKGADGLVRWRVVAASRWTK
jgi:hypothetical protein